jgi:hypothetical protein
MQQRAKKIKKQKNKFGFVLNTGLSTRISAKTDGLVLGTGLGNKTDIIKKIKIEK